MFVELKQSVADGGGSQEMDSSPLCLIACVRRGIRDEDAVIITGVQIVGEKWHREDKEKRDHSF